MSSADVRKISHTRELAHEMWLAEKIAAGAGISYCGMFAGATDRAMRARRARELILQHRLAALRPSSKRAENFADCFQRLYGEPLTTPTPSNSANIPQQLEVAL